MSVTVSVGNTAVTGSTERFEARGAINTAIRSRAYTNTGGGWGAGSNKDIATDRNVREGEKVEVKVL